MSGNLATSCIGDDRFRRFKSHEHPTKCCHSKRNSLFFVDLGQFSACSPYQDIGFVATIQMGKTVTVPRIRRETRSLCRLIGVRERTIFVYHSVNNFLHALYRHKMPMSNL
jgi:hypothetical protein